MIRIWQNLGLRLLILSAVLAVMALVALCLVLLVRTNQTQEFKEQAAQNCRQINVLKAALRASIDEAELTSLGRSDIDSERRRLLLEYYARQRARFAADECP